MFKFTRLVFITNDDIHNLQGIQPKKITQAYLEYITYLYISNSNDPQRSQGKQYLYMNNKFMQTSAYQNASKNVLQEDQGVKGHVPKRAYPCASTSMICETLFQPNPTNLRS